MGAMKGKEKSTKERLLDTAERLFAESGIQATSLREITEKAEANLAAVNYHFHSKEALVEAVFARRLIPLNAERIRLLDEAEAEARGRPLPIEVVLRAFFVAEFHLWEEDPLFIRLANRIEYEPDKKLHDFFMSHFQEVIRRFDAAVTRALPEIPRKELFYRMHFLVGGMIHTWICGDDLLEITGGACDPLKNAGETMERLIAFGAAGLRAPVPVPSRSA
jgi:AcrR family transcriptional regulator